MSQSLRAKIEAARRYGVSAFGVEERANGWLVSLDDILRIVDESERAQAAVAIGVRAVNGVEKESEEFRPGLPDAALRSACAEWECRERHRPEDAASRVCRFKGDEFTFSHWGPGYAPDIVKAYTWEGWRFRPHGKTWAEVEAMARSTEKQTP